MPHGYRGGPASGPGQRAQKKVLGKRHVEIVGDERDRVLDLLRPQIGLASGKVQATLLLVRHKVENWASVARHDNRFAFLDHAGKFGQTILASLVDTVFMTE